MFCGRLAATPFTLSTAKRLYRSIVFCFEVVSLLVVRIRVVGAIFAFSLFKDSKIQIQRRNRRAITMGYEAKSEEMGGIGEKLGGVA